MLHNSSRGSAATVSSDWDEIVSVSAPAPHPLTTKTVDLDYTPPPHFNQRVLREHLIAIYLRCRTRTPLQFIFFL